MKDTQIYSFDCKMAAIIKNLYPKIQIDLNK
jgi:hypothetical protein